MPCIFGRVVPIWLKSRPLQIDVTPGEDIDSAKCLSDHVYSCIMKDYNPQHKIQVVAAPHWVPLFQLKYRHHLIGHIWLAFNSMRKSKDMSHAAQAQWQCREATLWILLSDPLSGRGCS